MKNHNTACTHNYEYPVYSVNVEIFLVLQCSTQHVSINLSQSAPMRATRFFAPGDWDQLVVFWLYSGYTPKNKLPSIRVISI